MDSSTQDYGRLRDAVTACLNTHDLLGVMDHRAPANEYDSETEDFTRRTYKDEPVTPELVATIWHKWFGDNTKEPEPPTPGMAELAADLPSTKMNTTRRSRGQGMGGLSAPYAFEPGG
jgi:hypothetical protein